MSENVLFNAQRSVTWKENFRESFPFSYSLSPFQVLREILQFWWYKDVHAEFYPILFYCISPFHFSPSPPRKVLKNTPLSVSISIKYFTPRKSEFFVFRSTKVPFSFSFSYRFTTIETVTSYLSKKKKRKKKRIHQKAFANYQGKYNFRHEWSSEFAWSVAVV